MKKEYDFSKGERKESHGAARGKTAHPASCIDDAQPRTGDRDEAFDVNAVTRDDIRPPLHSEADYRGIGDIGCSRFPQQRASSVRSSFVQGNHLAAAQQTAELRLFRRTADLRDNRGGNAGQDAQFESRAMFCPETAVVSLGRNERARVINDRPHRPRNRRAPVPSACFARTRARALIISTSVKAPCSFSHSVTAASPSRRRSERCAAAVIHAETLRPSARAARTTIP
jgi:hypothetical protein